MAKSKYLEAASMLGARLCRDAIWSGTSCNWVGDSMEFIESRWQVTLCSCGPQFYNGVSGIAFFLAHLFASTHDKLFRKTATGAIHYALSQIDQFDPSISFGFYSGLLGIAFALMETGEIFCDDALTQCGWQLVEKLISQEPDPSQSWDIVSGSAGVVPVLLKLHARYDRPYFLDAAVRHGDYVVQAANHSDDGWSWTTVSEPEMKDLTGFSHGAAGIAWSLLELYQQSKEQRFLLAAQEAFRYERRWFDPQMENWPDFRALDQSGRPAYAGAWCHGAPGIGLSRLRCYQLLNDHECLAEAQAAIRTTTNMLNAVILNDQGNYSLCHGNCGNAELLIAAGDILGEKESLKLVQQMADGAFEKYLIGGNPWPCGVLNGGETPNLMLGLAGIGYFYLRLHDRKKTPSVLLVGPEPA